MLGAITKIKSSEQLQYLNDQEKIEANLNSQNFDLSYFTNANKVVKAEFYGTACERLGLKQDITSFEQVERLANGLHPITGKQLIKPVKDRVKGFEFSFSAEKSVSLLAQIGTEKQKEDIANAHRKAVKKSLDYLMSMDVARKDKGGLRKEKGECIASIHHHDESRELDPQIHSHVVLYNLAFSEEKFGSFNADVLFKTRLMLGQIYQNELATQLKNANIPIKTRKLDKGTVVEIDGMPEDFKDAFSKRSEQIEEYLKENKLSDTTDNRKKAALITRKEKDKSITTEELESHWQNEFQRMGFDTDEILNSISKAATKTTTTPEHSIEESIEAFDRLILEKKGTNATKNDLLLSELELSMGKLSPDQIYERVERIYNDERIIKIGNNIITKNLLSREESVIDFATSKLDTNSVKPNIYTKNVFDESCRRAKEISGYALNKEQEEAVKAIMFSDSNIVAIQGKAGTGKSSLLLAATIAMQLDGRKVYGTATAGKAAAGLSEAGMDGVENSSALLSKLKSGKIRLQERDVIVIDEAGMMNTAQFYALAKYAEKAKAKIVSLGDYEQLQAIGAGGIHKLICDTCGYVELKEVFRQKDKEDAAAGLEISAGNAIEAINHLKGTDRYKVCETKTAMVKAIASNISSSTTSYENKFAVADTREMGRVLSNEIQKMRLKKNEIQDAVEISIKDPNEPTSQLSQKFAAGDRIAFLKGSTKDNFIIDANNHLAKIENGHFGTITKIEEEDGAYRITANHDKLGEISFNTNFYKDFQLGYAGTLHKSQGATLKECHWGTENPDKHKGYVAATRHTEKNAFFLYTTKDAEADLATKLSTANYNKSAKELLAEISKKKIKYQAVEQKQKIEYKPEEKNNGTTTYTPKFKSSYQSSYQNSRSQKSPWTQAGERDDLLYMPSGSMAHDATRKSEMLLFGDETDNVRQRESSSGSVLLTEPNNNTPAADTTPARLKPLPVEQKPILEKAEIKPLHQPKPKTQPPEKQKPKQEGLGLFEKIIKPIKNIFDKKPKKKKEIHNSKNEKPTTKTPTPETETETIPSWFKGDYDQYEQYLRVKRIIETTPQEVIDKENKEFEEHMKRIAEEKATAQAKPKEEECKKKPMQQPKQKQPQQPQNRTR